MRSLGVGEEKIIGRGGTRLAAGGSTGCLAGCADMVSRVLDGDGGY